jgi:hypothetical protein
MEVLVIQFIQIYTGRIIRKRKKNKRILQIGSQRGYQMGCTIRILTGGDALFLLSHVTNPSQNLYDEMLPQQALSEWAGPRFDGCHTRSINHVTAE